MRISTWAGVACLSALAALAAAQATSSQPSNSMKTAVCNFADGRQFSVEYNRVPAKSDKKTSDAQATEGPMFLLTNAELKVAGTTLPVGAYSLYAIRGREGWMLAINKNVHRDVPYNRELDIVRVPLQTGDLADAVKKLDVYFGRIAPDRCEMRLSYGHTLAWTELSENKQTESAGTTP